MLFLMGVWGLACSPLDVRQNESMYQYLEQSSRKLRPSFLVRYDFKVIQSSLGGASAVGSYF